MYMYMSFFFSFLTSRRFSACVLARVRPVVSCASDAATCCTSRDSWNRYLFCASGDQKRINKTEKQRDFTNSVQLSLADVLRENSPYLRFDVCEKWYFTK